MQGSWKINYIDQDPRFCLNLAVKVGLETPMDFKTMSSDYTSLWVEINYNHLPQIHVCRGQVRQLHWEQVEDGILLAHFEALDVRG